MPRQYNKKSEYWNLRSQNLLKQAVTNPGNSIVAKLPGSAVPNDFSPDLVGGEHFTAVAACGGGTNTSENFRDGNAPTIREVESFKNIKNGIAPFDELDGHVGVSSCVQLCNLAYFNVPIFRNTIDIMQELSSSSLHIKTTNNTVKEFFENWMMIINMPDFQDQWFREYFRSGNVFIYSFDGRIQDEIYDTLQKSFGATSPKLPIRYVILNPMQVYLQGGAGYNNTYIKMLSTYEITRLRDPKTPEDVAVYNSLPDYIKQQIKMGAGYRYLFVPLERDRLFYCFYKKQSYEPLAVPMGYPVLPDIEFKLEMKRADMALFKTLEQVILLVTAGEKADNYGNGINPKVLNDLKAIFQNQTIGRVLVADYTTKAQFVIPDIKDLIGPAKYERVDRDIREGLQYIAFGEEKFANATVKVKILIERLREGQGVFLNNWLMPQVRKICKAMNFKNIPTFEFEQINLQDEAVMNRIYAQLAQIGILTPEETFNALETGLLPDADVSAEHQLEYHKQRVKGLYLPLIGQSPQQAAGRPAGTPSPQTTKNVKPIGTKTTAISGHYFGAIKVAENVRKINALYEMVEAAWKKKAKVKTFTPEQEDVVKAYTRTIFVNEDEGKWKTVLASYMDSPKEISTETGKEIDDIAFENDTDLYTASILYRSQVEKPTD
jgi:hypothetical protein